MDTAHTTYQGLVTTISDAIKKPPSRFGEVRRKHFVKQIVSRSFLEYPESVEVIAHDFAEKIIKTGQTAIQHAVFAVDDITGGDDPLRCFLMYEEGYLNEVTTSNQVIPAYKLKFMLDNLPSTDDLHVGHKLIFPVTECPSGDLKQAVFVVRGFPDEKHWALEL